MSNRHVSRVIGAVEIERLLRAARAAREFAHAPYSRLRVGAAVLCDDDSIVSGANVENASYGLTLCAERSAISAAVSMGQRQFRAIAVSSTAGELTPPCGACRQVLSEFCPPTLRVVLDQGHSGDPEIVTLAELLPLAFRFPPG